MKFEVYVKSVSVVVDQRQFRSEKVAVAFASKQQDSGFRVVIVEL